MLHPLVTGQLGHGPGSPYLPFRQGNEMAQGIKSAAVKLEKQEMGMKHQLVGNDTVAHNSARFLLLNEKDLIEFDGSPSRSGHTDWPS
jgi:hypothetical protein